MSALLTRLWAQSCSPRIGSVGPDSSSPLGDEELRKIEKPIVTSDYATKPAADLFGLRVIPDSIKDLDSYDDATSFRAKPFDLRPALVEAADQHARPRR